MNNTLRDYLDIFYTTYLDNILIYSKTRSKYIEYVYLVLEKLREAGLYTKFQKYKFLVSETKFLDIIIGRDRIRIDPKKVRMITD